jgi:hypothetical protein
LVRESPQNGAGFFERSQNRINVMVGSYECCDTLLTIEPVLDYTISLREPWSTDNNRGDQGLVWIWSMHLAAIQKQPPSVSDDIVKEGKPFRGYDPGLGK